MTYLSHLKKLAEAANEQCKCFPGTFCKHDHALHSLGCESRTAIPRLVEAVEVMLAFIDKFPKHKQPCQWSCAKCSTVTRIDEILNGGENG